MRSCLYVDADSGLCRIQPLPPELKASGGRALASCLAAEKPGRLCLAPGLLTGSRCASAGRCAVSCSHADGQVFHSNAGGAAGPAMAAAGLAAIVVECGRGAAVPASLRDLVIGRGEAHLVPTAVRSRGVPGAMAELASAYPDAAALISSGSAGMMGLPMASLTFSDHRLKASSHAGSGSGTLLCRGGLRSIAFLKDISSHARVQEGVAEATLRFVKVLKGVRGDEPVASHGCTSSCVLDCHKNSAASSGKKSGGRSGWPGFQRLWATGDAELDAMLAGRFMKLCDEIGADAFALGSVLELAAGQGMLASGNGEAALAELAKLASAGESLLRAPAMAWSMGAGKKASHGEDMQGVVMDCLGICRFAADAMMRSGDVREAVLDLLRCLHGLGEEDLYLMAAAGLAAEKGRDDI